MSCRHSRPFQTFLAIAFLALPALGQAPDTGTVLLRVRDSRTGQGLASGLEAYRSHLAAPFGLSRSTLARAVGPSPTPEIARAVAPQGPTRVELAPGTHVFELRAPGHRTLDTYFEVAAGRETDVTVWLDPDSPPRDLEPGVVASRLRPGYAMLHGHVTDAVTGRPVVGAVVSLRRGGESATSDERGYFRLYAPAEEPPPAGLPNTTDLVVELPGYQTYVISDTFLTPGETHYLVDLQPGEGVGGRSDRHELLRYADAVAGRRPGNGPLIQGGEPAAGEVGGAAGPAYPDRARPELPAEAAGALAAQAGTDLRAMSAGAAAFIDPPDSIRVGFSNSGGTCCTGSCGSVSVFSLEEYVRRGLGDEWIASWGQQSLRSGAVPYRSYGAWYALHPVRTSYDICSSACCQVNDSDTASSTTTARDLTAGIVLVQGGAIARSEYSAENNSWNDPNDGLICSNSDLSCGDGYVGSPVAGWPCLFDTVALGHGCFGHGRGESQWGTSRWDSTYGRKWKWIADHYYNANGSPSGQRSSSLSSPIRVTGASASPSSVARGSSFTIDVGAASAAGLSHGQVMIGASLYSSATGYLSDPARDRKVTVVPGSSTVSRSFVVPTAAQLGTYDLVVALWLDVDQTNTINGEDLVLSVWNLPGEVSVH